jgi:CMP-N-acetylneuraminic acid synthetase
MTSYAFVFARGGSKGLPGKNLKPLAGKPLLHYSIDTAKQVAEISRIFVSTDDPSIASAAQEKGAIVIDRPASLAQDNTPEWLAWQHAVEWVEARYGSFEQFVSLPATSPLRSPDDVVNAMVALRQADADVCITVTASHRSPFFNMVVLDEKGIAQLVNRGKGQAVFRRQDAPVVYDITTVAYVADPAFIKENGGIFDGNVVAVEVPKRRAVDIDDHFDFRYAEVLLAEEGHDT